MLAYAPDTRLAKIITPRERREALADQRALLAIADKAVPQVGAAVLAVLTAWKDGWTLDDIERLLVLAPGTLADAMDPTRPGHGALLKAAHPDRLTEVLLRVLAASSEHPTNPALRGVFDIHNPRAIRLAEQRAATLVRAVSAETRASIRQIVASALGRGGPGNIPAVARQVRSVIGLHPRQTAAVLRFSGLLQSAAAGDRGAARTALGYALRDGRLRIGEGMTQSQIDRAVERYAARSLRYRSEMIARTESVWATNRGRLEGWQEAVDQGLLAPGWIEWMVNPDDALCDDCASMEGATADDADNEGASGSALMTPGGIGLNESLATFRSESGMASEAPPLHPMCRCTLVYHDDLSASPVGPRTVISPENLAGQRLREAAASQAQRRGEFD